MATIDYYNRWLSLKKQLNALLIEDAKIHDWAINYVGIKPQSNAVEVVTRMYGRYCVIYNQLCDLYDQMEQVQRRPFIKKIIDAITCRIIDYKKSLQEIEVFEYTYTDNGVQQMLMTPVNIEVACPFFYPFEIRKQELQYIVDQIFAGNRLGDPEPTPSELERLEEERLEAERIKQEEKQAETLRKLAMGEDIEESIKEKQLNPVALELKRRHQEYLTNINNIQRMERCRLRTRAMLLKKSKDDMLYLELAGLKKPPNREELRRKAAELIVTVYKQFMQEKRRHYRDMTVKTKLGMIMPAWTPPSAKVELARVQAIRREFRRKYYEEWLEENIREKAKVFKLREGKMMEDIGDELRQWYTEWYGEVKAFDEFPWPLEGGSIVIARGETFSIEEYVIWKEIEAKKLQKESGNPKTKDQIKQEKLAAKEEKKKIVMQAKTAETKRIADYKKQRLNPETDPGCYVLPDRTYEPIAQAWASYQNQWRTIDRGDADKDVKQRYIMELITEDAYKSVQLDLRPLVDDELKLELKLLQKALKYDLLHEDPPLPMPLVKKRKKPKKPKKVKPEKIPPEVMFQTLVDGGIVKKYPKFTLEDFWGDRNFAAAELRGIPWTPSFPPPCLGDVREQVRLNCLLALGSECRNVVRTQLLVGHRHCGKRTLAYAVAAETNSIIIDLSPKNIFNKFLGAKNQKMMFVYCCKIAKIMQPTIILVKNAERMFYKKVPKEEKMFDPTRLQKDFYKELIKPIAPEDRIMVIGTANEPWLGKVGPMYKIFSSVILIPRTDYGSISFVLNSLLMKYHGVSRDFNLHSVAQVLKGYDIMTIKKAVEIVLSAERIGTLYHKPLHPQELIDCVLEMPDAIQVDAFDNQIYVDWYRSYTPWGEKYFEFLIMLETQLQYYLKRMKKKKTA